MKKTIDNITKYLYDNRIYIITIVIMITVMIMGQILSCSIPFGNNNIVAGDGLYQEYPVFSHKMRRGCAIDVLLMANNDERHWEVVRGEIRVSA